MLVYDIQHLTMRYAPQARPANNDICLQLYKGEILGILGDNGAGKSTLIRQMVNLLRPTSGSITLFGRPVSADPLHVPAHVGYMPQDTQALNCMTVGEALYFTAHLRGLSRAAACAERDRLLEVWDIVPLRDQPSPRLSGGQRRLLRLAVAMAAAPPVLVLDEPTNELDPLRRRLVWDTLRRLKREQGATIVFVTHDAIEAEKVIDRVAIMRDGRLAAVGRPSDLKRAVDQLLRLEVWYMPGAPPAVGVRLQGREVQPGRAVYLVRREDAAGVLQALQMDRVDDFGLYSATLEDLYVHYANGSH